MESVLNKLSDGFCMDCMAFSRALFSFPSLEIKKPTQAGVAAGAWTRGSVRRLVPALSLTQTIYFLFLGATSHSRTRSVGPGDVEGSLSSDSKTDHFNPSSTGAEKEQSNLGIVYQRSWDFAA